MFYPYNENMDICITQYNLYRTPLTYKKDFEKKKKLQTSIHPFIFYIFYLFIYLFILLYFF